MTQFDYQGHRAIILKGRNESYYTVTIHVIEPFKIVKCLILCHLTLSQVKSRAKKYIRDRMAESNLVFAFGQVVKRPSYSAYPTRFGES